MKGLQLKTVKVRHSGYKQRVRIPDLRKPVHPPALPDEPPWNLKLCAVDTLLINYGKKQDHPEFLKTLALEKIDYYKNSVHRPIYTDASKTTTNKTSAAFCIPELNIQYSVRLSDNITIFAAELSAIN